MHFNVNVWESVRIRETDRRFLAQEQKNLKRHSSETVWTPPEQQTCEPDLNSRGLDWNKSNQLLGRQSNVKSAAEGFYFKYYLLKSFFLWTERKRFDACVTCKKRQLLLKLTHRLLNKPLTYCQFSFNQWVFDKFQM